MQLMLGLSITSLVACGGGGGDDSNNGESVDTRGLIEGQTLYKLEHGTSTDDGQVFDNSRFWCDSLRFSGGVIYVNFRTLDNLSSCTDADIEGGTYTINADGTVDMHFSMDNINLTFSPIDSTQDFFVGTIDSEEGWYFYDSKTLPEQALNQECAQIQTISRQGISFEITQNQCETPQSLSSCSNAEPIEGSWKTEFMRNGSPATRYLVIDGNCTFNDWEYGDEQVMDEWFGGLDAGDYIFVATPGQTISNTENGGLQLAEVNHTAFIYDQATMNVVETWGIHTLGADFTFTLEGDTLTLFQTYTFNGKTYQSEVQFFATDWTPPSP